MYIMMLSLPQLFEDAVGFEAWLPMFFSVLGIFIIYFERLTTTPRPLASPRELNVFVQDSSEDAWEVNLELDRVGNLSHLLDLQSLRCPLQDPRVAFADDVLQDSMYLRDLCPMCNEVMSDLKTLVFTSLDGVEQMLTVCGASVELQVHGLMIISRLGLQAGERGMKLLNMHLLHENKLVCRTALSVVMQMAASVLLFKVNCSKHIIDGLVTILLHFGTEARDSAASMFLMLLEESHTHAMAGLSNLLRTPSEQKDAVPQVRSEKEQKNALQSLRNAAKKLNGRSMGKVCAILEKALSLKPVPASLSIAATSIFLPDEKNVELEIPTIVACSCKSSLCSCSVPLDQGSFTHVLAHLSLPCIKAIGLASRGLLDSVYGDATPWKQLLFSLLRSEWLVDFAITSASRLTKNASHARVCQQALRRLVVPVAVFPFGYQWEFHSSPDVSHPAVWFSF
mmetsp:Transcript_74225/g.135542  ORF Transcript_74225/g.135542 Transcript_74225/m.135542 type:complete len:453 (+) Transcript_74225:119-1477(+)